MKVNIKKISADAVIPQYAKPGDAGLDLIAVWKSYDHKTRVKTYGTGLCVEIPDGYVGLLFPRSSVHKFSLTLANCVGVIDSGYRGELIFKFRVLGEGNNHSYSKGDRVGQLLILPYPRIEFQEVKELEASDRGEGGFGSTGV
jgi:dUTP pyrophosphatase